MWPWCITPMLVRSTPASITPRRLTTTGCSRRSEPSAARAKRSSNPRRPVHSALSVQPPETARPKPLDRGETQCGTADGASQVVKKERLPCFVLRKIRPVSPANSVARRLGLARSREKKSHIADEGQPQMVSFVSRRSSEPEPSIRKRIHGAPWLLETRKQQCVTPWLNRERPPREFDSQRKCLLRSRGNSKCSIEFSVIA